MSYLIRSLIFAICLLVPPTSGAIAAESFDDPGRRFSIAHDPDFPHASDVMDRLVRSHRLTKTDNDFCVVGYQQASEKIAWVFWANRKSLILWEPQKQPVADLSMSRRQLDLHRDVVADEASLRGSTYRVTQAWVDRVIDDCDAVGLKIFFARK